MIAIRHADEIAAKQFVLGEIERLGRPLSQPADQPRLALSRRKIAEIEHADGHRLGRPDHLHRGCVDDAEIGPQNLMAAHDLGQRRLERVQFERLGRAQGPEGVEHRTVGKELLKQPLTLLGERQRCGGLAAAPGYRRSGADAGRLSAEPPVQESPLIQGNIFRMAQPSGMRHRYPGSAEVTRGGLTLHSRGKYSDKLKILSGGPLEFGRPMSPPPALPPPGLRTVVCQ